MQSIPASPDGSAASGNHELSAAQEKPAGSREPVSTPVINSDPTRGKFPFAPDAISGNGVEKSGTHASAEVEIVQANKLYQKRGIHLFVGECYSPAGEKIHVGMELIDEKNLAAAQLYANGGRSLVRGVATIFERALRGRQAPEKTDKQLNLLGIRNRDHVRELTQKPSKDDSYENRGEEIMASVHGAAAGFSPIANGMQYLTYASSQPIPEAGLLASLPTKCCLEDRDDLLRFFREKYGHLIMSVVSRLANDGETLENRGVLKNPIFMLEGSFREIAIPVIHGFSALIAAHEFGRTKFMVGAMGEMHNMMKAALPASDFIIPVSEKTTFHKDNYLVAKLGGLQQKFIACSSLPAPSTDPELVVREKQDQQ